MHKTTIKKAIDYNLPFLSIINKRGFFWLHEETIREIDPFNIGIFHVILKKNGVKIIKKNETLNLYKIVKQ